MILGATSTANPTPPTVSRFTAAARASIRDRTRPAANVSLGQICASISGGTLLLQQPHRSIVTANSYSSNRYMYIINQSITYVLQMFIVITV